MIESIINCKDLKKADAIVLTVGYDRTASGRKGAVNGGNAIIKSLNEDLEFFEPFSKTEPKNLFKLAHKDLGNLNRLLPEAMVEKVNQGCAKIFNKNNFLLLLGGEHSISLGILKFFSKIFKTSDITILQIDAHADLRNDDSNANPNATKPSRYAHACVMRRAYEMDFKIVQVGVRSLAKEENDFIKENKISIFEWGMGKIPEISEIVDSIKTKKIYLSLDVDGIDPSHMPATGTPVQGGLEWYYTLNLIREVIKKRELIAADIVEVSPRKDDNLTEYGAARLCYHIISAQLLKKGIR